MPTAQSSYARIFYISAFVFLIGWLVVSLMGQHSWAGWPLALFFLCLGIGFRGSKVTKGFSFTVIILSVVSLAMYYPDYFKAVGGRETAFLIPILLQVIMFGMGTELSLKDFAQVLRMPKGVIVGIVCHYTIMPLVGFAVAHMFNFPDEIAAGIILVGCCPSGLASNVMCYLAKANLALSVSVTTIIYVARSYIDTFADETVGGSYVEIDFWRNGHGISLRL